MTPYTPFPSDFDTLIIHANIATFNEHYGFVSQPSDGQDHVPYGQLLDAAVAIQAGKIVWLGDSQTALDGLGAHHEEVIGAAEDELEPHYELIDAENRWLTPGLIDCHTHLVYGGNRSDEFEARLKGVSYKAIAENGGGIVATVSATRQASSAELYQQSEKRLQALLKEGLTCIEIKSGYGLDLATERKMLQVARQLGEDYGITVKTTYLAAHALPPEYKDNADGYIEQVCAWLPILHKEGLVDAVDGFCENIGFTVAQMQRVFDVAKELGLPVKLHAEQLSDMDGSALVTEYQGLSSDHLEYLSAKNAALMGKSGTVAVLLPGAFYTLRETKLPPMDALREHQVPIALSTDCNPGTSPLTSLLLTVNMGCTLFSMTPEEALTGITIHAAKALGLANKGQIGVGMDADLALWDITRPADLAYQIGFNPLSRVMIAGDWRA
ncbi:imidazolonepropionase [Psychrobacter arenosus]|uniref:imidazolonepropionase n=1 Tax=Psychrobacter arenosus TaxID=256326 RepID=UPI00191A6366|nr:imidazolonepropionase [Psychrobacter arenosus]